MELTKKRRNQLMLRWSFLSAGAIALFWFIWYLIAGSVPVVTEMQLTPRWIYTLPFGVSRWWDILLGPVTAIIVIWQLHVYKDDSNKREGLIFGLTFGLGFPLVVGLIFGLTFGLGFPLVVGLIFGLTFGLIVGLIVGLIGWLIFGLTFGLIWGLIFGIPWSIPFLLLSALSTPFLYLLKSPQIKSGVKWIWCKSINWLIAKPSVKTITPKPTKIETKRVRLQNLRTEAFQLEQEITEEEPNAYRSQAI